MKNIIYKITIIESKINRMRFNCQFFVDSITIGEVKRGGK